MKIYKKNKKKLIEGKVYDPSMEHEACGVGLIATTNGQKSREVVEHGIKALKAVWHRGAVDLTASQRWSWHKIGNFTRLFQR